MSFAVKAAVAENGEWKPVEGAALARACARLGVVVDAYTTEEAEAKLAQAQAKLPYKDTDELSVEAKGEALEAIESMMCKRHYYDVQAFHYVADGACSFTFSGLAPARKEAAEGGDSKVDEDGADSSLRLECTRGAVVIALPRAIHTFALGKARFLKMTGMYDVKPDTIVPHFLDETA